MTLKLIGLITYNFPHLKTEQVVEPLLNTSYHFKFYALPYKPRKKRETRISHRPEQTAAIAPSVIAAKHRIPFVVCDADTDIAADCDLYLILGAGIISAAAVAGKRIINCHPGIIPASRGLDSFKWALYEMKPLGVTLHYIDKEVDKGEILAVSRTNVYSTDTLSTLARRHYENEIHCLTRFDHFVDHPSNDFRDVPEGESKMRMPLDKEAELEKRFADYVKSFGAS